MLARHDVDLPVLVGQIAAHFQLSGDEEARLLELSRGTERDVRFNLDGGPLKAMGRRASHAVQATKDKAGRRARPSRAALPYPPPSCGRVVVFQGTAPPCWRPGLHLGESRKGD